MDDEQKIAQELLKIASDLMSAKEEDDPKLAETLRIIRPQLLKLRSKGKRKLSQYNIDTIRPTATVGDLVNALSKVIQQAGSSNK